MQDMSQEPRICDYQESTYRTDFWEGQGREYEDRVERIALRKLLPPTGRRLIDIGGGFGRLSEFYVGYEQTIILDYSTSLLRQAQERLGRDGRVLYVAASFYALPFVDNALDTAMMVRVMHHAEDVSGVLSEIARVLRADGTFVLEFASKRHLKAILRYLLRRQDWSPFAPDPYEFAEMNLNFHPDWMRVRLSESLFHVKQCRTTSHFRVPILKKLVPARALAALDGLCQPTGAWWQLTPSVFVQCAADKAGISDSASGLFCCPACSSGELDENSKAMRCKNCGTRWPIEDGIYNFKTPLPA